MKIKESVRYVTIEFKEDELMFLIDVLRNSNNASAINLAGALREALATQTS